MVIDTGENCTCIDCAPPPVLYLDFETSGLDPRRHSILQAAWILECRGEVVSEKCFDVMIDHDTDICLGALDANHFTLERLKQGKSLSYVICALKADLISFPVSDKIARLCGHNIQFDMGFLRAACDKVKENLHGHLSFHTAIDILSILRWHDYLGTIKIPDYKLESVCRYYNIPIQAHDALEDVRACRKILYLMRSLSVAEARPLSEAEKRP